MPLLQNSHISYTVLDINVWKTDKTVQMNSAVMSYVTTQLEEAELNKKKHEGQ